MVAQAHHRSRPFTDTYYYFFICFELQYADNSIGRAVIFHESDVNLLLAWVFVYRKYNHNIRIMTVVGGPDDHVKYV